MRPGYSPTTGGTAGPCTHCNGRGLVPITANCITIGRSDDSPWFDRVWCPTCRGTGERTLEIYTKAVSR